MYQTILLAFYGTGLVLYVARSPRPLISYACGVECIYKRQNQKLDQLHLQLCYQYYYLFMAGLGTD